MLYTKKRRNSSNQDGWSSLRLGGHKTWLVLFCASPNVTICLRPLLNSFGKYTSHTHIHTLHHGAYGMFLRPKKQKLVFMLVVWKKKINGIMKFQNIENKKISIPITQSLIPSCQRCHIFFYLILWFFGPIVPCLLLVEMSVRVYSCVCVRLHGYEHKWPQQQRNRLLIRLLLAFELNQSIFTSSFLLAASSFHLAVLIFYPIQQYSRHRHEPIEMP